jgi:hypothetical protein
METRKDRPRNVLRILLFSRSGNITPERSPKHFPKLLTEVDLPICSSLLPLTHPRSSYGLWFGVVTTEARDPVVAEPLM